MTFVTIVSRVIVEISLGAMVDRIVAKVLIWVVPHKVTGGRISHIVLRRPSGDRYTSGHVDHVDSRGTYRPRSTRDPTKYDTQEV
jgi:hypothetical protein